MMENNIQQLAAKFNQEHGRAMTFDEAEEIILDTDFPIVDVSNCDRDTAELYSESCKQFERTKVIEEAHNQIMVQWEKAFGSIHNDQKLDAYTVSEFIKSSLKNE